MDIDPLTKKICWTGKNSYVQSLGMNADMHLYRNTQTTTSCYGLLIALVSYIFKIPWHDKSINTELWSFRLVYVYKKLHFRVFLFIMSWNLDGRINKFNKHTTSVYCCFSITLKLHVIIHSQSGSSEFFTI